MNFLERIRDDVSTWTPAMKVAWQQEVERLQRSAQEQGWKGSEVELRAWVDTRCGEFAREPVILNRHHLTPSAGQADDSQKWPAWAIYCGRVPIATKDSDANWRFSRALGNEWARRDYPDALERYRQKVRKAIMEDRAGKHNAMVDAIRSILPRHALACSCVSSPWTPTSVIPPGEPLGSEWTCHCHLIVVAWRALQKRKVA